MEWIICPACQKRIKSLRAHFRTSHPGLDIPDLRKPALDQYDESMRTHQEQSKEQPAQELPPEPPQEPSPEAPQSDLLQKLKAFGIDPNDIMVAFTPMIEKSVVKTLEKMQLGEAINKRVAEVETKLGEQIKPLTDLAKQAQGQTSGNGGEVAGGRNALMETVLAGIAQKLLNPNSGGFNLENLVKQQTSLYQLIEAVTKPQRDAEDAMLRRVTAIINLGAKAGKTPGEALGAYGNP